MEIDLVYLWVDGNDPVWLAKKNAYLPVDRQVDPEAAGECRFVENDELRYSLRSAERYAPWIRRIYILTDDQTPAWLDTSNPRVRVVSHREIMPAEILPVFNSCTSCSCPGFPAWPSISSMPTMICFSAVPSIPGSFSTKGDALSCGSKNNR